MVVNDPIAPGRKLNLGGLLGALNFAPLGEQHPVAHGLDFQRINGRRRDEKQQCLGILLELGFAHQQRRLDDI